MGAFLYGPAERTVEINDRSLAHLQNVIVAKLRRNEPFQFTWVPDPEMGGGRRVFWLHPATPLQFAFDDARPIALNRAWLEALTLVAAGPRGLSLIPEPADEPTP